MVQRTILLLCASATISLLGAATPTSARSDALDEAFKAPPPAARPYARWWWPGGAVEDPELIREIELMARSGFGGAEIQAFNPGITDLRPAERLHVNDYANPAFFAHVRIAAQAAERSGFKLDYTFGSAWPSGGGLAVTPELALVELTQAITEVSGGVSEPIKVAIPARSRKLGAMNSLDARNRDPRAAGWRDRLNARQKIVAVIAVPGQPPQLKPRPKEGLQLFPWSDVARSGQIDMAKAVVLTDKLQADGTLDWTPPPGRWQVFVFKQYAVDSSVLAGVGEGPQLVLDHLRRDAFQAHAQRVGDPLIKGPLTAGKSLNATFVDSLELMQDLPWTDEFLAEFRRRRGYDLTPYLPLILQPGWMQAWNEHYSPPYFGDDLMGERVRADYRLTVSDLQLENFWRPFVAWNHAHGLKARIQVHGASVDTLKAYGLADIPETEDLGSGGDPIFMRMARSAADLYGRRMVSAESFVWPGEAYEVTPAKMRQRADLLFAGGVNRIVFHGYPYVRQTSTWPGWHPFAPGVFGDGFSTHYNERNPIFAAAPALNTYIARTQAVLQSGRNVVPVALFLGEIGYYHGLESKGDAQHDLAKSLIEHGYDSDRINADALADARVRDGQLVTAGGARYQVLVLPPVTALRVETAEHIARLAAKGLKVIYTDATPQREEGLFDAQARDRRVLAAMSASMTAGARVVPAATAPDALAAAGVAPNLKFQDETALFVERALGRRRIVFLHNRQERARSVTFTVQVKGRAEAWDAWTGEKTAVPSLASTAGSTVTVNMPAGGSALIVFDPAKPALAQASALAESELMTLPNEGWSLQVDGHRSKNQVEVWSTPSAVLGDWRSSPQLATFAGKATYARTVNIDALAPGGRTLLDLGEVHDLAEVRVNGVAFGPLIGPFRADVSAALRRGENHIEILVMTTPNNALVDPSKPALKTLTSKPAGLVGPIRLLQQEIAATGVSGRR
jgi:hypothetical protein